MKNKKPKMTVNKLGTKRWNLNGKPHREDGPAVEMPSGYKAWYKHGLRHRADGPAKEWADGYKEWWLNGDYYETKQEWRAALRPLKIKIVLDSRQEQV